MTPASYTEALRAVADPAYADFQAALIPTIARERVLGVRMPALRALAKRLTSDEGKDAFYHALPHAYYDEDNLHGCLIAAERDFDRVIAFWTLFCRISTTGRPVICCRRRYSAVTARHCSRTSAAGWRPSTSTPAVSGY